VNATDLLGPFAGEVEAGARKVVSSNLLEDTGLPLIKVKLGNGGNVVEKRVGVQKLDDAVGVGIGERLEQHRIDHRKDGGIDADTEGKREHRDEGKSRRLTQLAQCVAYVPLHSLQQHS
jgi:hypothetical protein